MFGERALGTLPDDLHKGAVDAPLPLGGGEEKAVTNVTGAEKVVSPEPTRAVHEEQAGK